ncbi:DUF3043 domain-containing protein [Corynebacterium timonense]|uniref:DUF3043 domain-containing protein n=1 Tax=Corynebacterium timonense TaxID=441500 RepID=A0A1H1MGL2_9CORY|nr:DUF3043 domain-containing protein [Corynebacterium timonense]SDR85984.1 Protein of unknown function [Corynebacterium timonense]
MKLPWKKTDESAEAADPVVLEQPVDEPAPALPKGYTPPKGRPTPKRNEQEIKRGVRRDPDALTPAQRRQREKEMKKNLPKEEWKAYKRQRREEARATNKHMQERIDAGDERYLLDRDKGEVRLFARNWVDARRFANNYVMPATLVMLLILLISTVFPRASAVLSLVTMVFIIAIFAEGITIGVRANRAVRERFPSTTETGFGLGVYAFSRATQPRNWRSPKPQVSIGDTV